MQKNKSAQSSQRTNICRKKKQRFKKQIPNEQIKTKCKGREEEREINPPPTNPQNLFILLTLNNQKEETKMLYQTLCNIYEDLEQNPSRLKKTEMLSKFLKTIKHDKDKQIIYLLQGKAFPDYSEKECL